MEWVPVAGEKTLRNCLETFSLAEAYDRVYPLPKEERPNLDPAKGDKEGQEERASAGQEHTEVTISGATVTTTEESTDAQPAQPSISESTESPTKPTEDKPSDLPVGPHRSLYFYLHRPRTTTKKPVLIPLPPSATLATVLRERTVLEFPTIYVLPDSAETLLAEKETSRFILEAEYLRTAGTDEAAEKSAESEQEDMGSEDDATGLPGVSVDLRNVDEKKVMEVLKQDLFESVPETGV